MPVSMSRCAGKWCRLTGAMNPWLSRPGQICLSTVNTFCTRASGRPLSEYLTSSHVSGFPESFCKFLAKVRAHIVDKDGMCCSDAVCKVRTDNVDVDGAVGWDCGVGISSSAWAVRASAFRRFGGGPRDARERLRLLMVPVFRECDKENKRDSAQGVVFQATLSLERPEGYEYHMTRTRGVALVSTSPYQPAPPRPVAVACAQGSRASDKLQRLRKQPYVSRQCSLVLPPMCLCLWGSLTRIPRRRFAGLVQ